MPIANFLICVCVYIYTHIIILYILYNGVILDSCLQNSRNLTESLMNSNKSIYFFSYGIWKELHCLDTLSNLYCLHCNSLILSLIVSRFGQKVFLYIFVDTLWQYIPGHFITVWNCMPLCTSVLWLYLI